VSPVSDSQTVELYSTRCTVIRKDTAAAGSYTFVITVTSFFLWYRPIYMGYRKEGGLALFFCQSPRRVSKRAGKLILELMGLV
jgi:hypothetical protein